MSEHLRDNINTVNDEGDVLIRDDLMESTHNEVLQRTVVYDNTEYMFSPFVDPLERSGALERFEKGVVASPEQQETTPSERPERLMQAQEQHHFYPQTKQELVQVTAFTGDAYPVGGAAQFLNEVLLGRKKHESITDPAKALRKMVRDWEGYVKSSTGDIHFLNELRTELTAEGLNPLGGITNISGIRDWQYQETTHRALGALIRHQDIDALARGEGEDYLDAPYVTHDRDVVARQAAVVNRLRVGETRQLIDTVIDQQLNRIEFWKARLEEATAHAAVHRIARVALDNFNKK